MSTRSWMVAALFCATASGLCGCASFGAERLDRDEVDYARALAFSKKQQTLANIVSLRYADAPSFLSVTQIIAGHSQVASVTGTGTVAATAANSSSVLGGTLSFSNNPTFTFTPTTGEELAASYIRPLAPAMILPLAQSGVPIDLLLRIAVQSVGDLQNSAALGGAGSAGSIGFFQLTHALRRLQIAGALTVRYEKDNAAGRVFLAIDAGPQPPDAVAADEKLVRDLLHAKAREMEFVYGSAPQDGSRISIVTRSMQSILTEIGAQIELPADEIKSHAVMPTVQIIGVETRPIIIVHVGAKAPSNAFVDIAYGDHHYWIDTDDFDSKFAFSVVQDLIALAEVNQNGKQAIVTIPAS
jgi:hypothetical protein